MLMYVIAAAVTVLTFGAIVKKLEVRLALLTGGLIMAVIAGTRRPGPMPSPGTWSWPGCSRPFRPSWVLPPSWS